MGSIRGEIIAGIGLIVALTSFFNKALIIFVYVGVIMFIYGGGKALFTALQKPKKHLHTHQTAHHVPHAQHNHQHSQHTNQQHAHSHAQGRNQMHPQFAPHSIVQKQQSPGAHSSVRKCPNCHTVMPTTFRHCPSCGYGF